MKKVYFILSCLLTLHAWTAAGENRLYIEDFSIDPGATVDLAIMLNNDVTDFASFQADLYLPEGLELVQQYNEDDEEYYIFSLTTRARNRMAIGSATQSDGAVRLMLTQTIGSSIQTIKETSGALVTFQVKATDTASGTKYIRLENVVFTTATSTQYTLENTQTTVTVTGSSEPENPTGNRLYIEDFSIDPGATVDVSIMLDNEVTNFASFQADMYLPDGTELVEQYNEDDEEYYIFSLTTRARSRMSIGSAVQSDGAVRLMLTQTIGSSIQTIQGTSGALVTFQVKAADNASGTKYIRLENIVFTTSTSTQYTLENTQTTVTISASQPVVLATGISLYNTSLTLTEAGQTATLTATVTPSNATNKNVTWTSSNIGVATVSNTGVVTAVADGTAVITATTADGTNLTAQCTVTVNIPVPATGISLNNTSLTLTEAGQTATLTATVTPSNATNKNVTWTSSNTGVATVSSTGLVTSIANGTAVITATTADGTNLTAQCTVTVSIPVPATGISLNNTTLTLTEAGQTATLTATVTPSNATNKNVTWTSSNTGVATVSSTGVVTAVADGTAVITATTADGTNLTAQCTVTVSISVINNIVFEDEIVKALCVANWDTNGDGELSMDEAAAVTTLGTVFKGNTQIVSFNELQYFTGLKSIKIDAFKDCSGLTSIIIPEGVTSIGNSAFYGCSSLTTINIPEGVTSISQYAFRNCSSLTIIIIPDGMTSIGNAVFYGCSGLTSITIPESVTTIEDAAFRDCSGLTSINIPEGVTSIGNYVFCGCSSLTSINIPEGVTSIGDDAFYGCSGLTSINIPEGVTSIGNMAFRGCNNLVSIIIPESVTSIGSSTFSNCSNLAVVNIPDGVTSIGEYAFHYCTSLTSVNIPASVTSIGQYAFYCSSLTNVIVLNKIPVSITSSTFSNRTKATLYVPYGSKAAYEAADYWKEFKEIIEMEGDGEKCAAPTISFVNGKLTFSSETEGVEFVSRIIVADANTYNSDEINLTTTYHVVVYATKAGYANSDITSADINVKGLHGDVNGDGTVSISDAVTVVNIILENNNSDGSRMRTKK